MARGVRSSVVSHSSSSVVVGRFAAFRSLTVLVVWATVRVHTKRHESCSFLAYSLLSGGDWQRALFESDETQERFGSDGPSVLLAPNPLISCPEIKQDHPLNLSI